MSTPSTIKRAVDTNGEAIRTYLDPAGAAIQSVGIADELGLHAGISTNPIHVQGEVLVAIQAAVEALGTLARILQISGAVSITGTPTVTVANKPEVSIPDPVTVQGELIVSSVTQAIQTVVSEIDTLTRHLLNSPLVRAPVDSAGRQRVTVDNVAQNSASYLAATTGSSNVSGPTMGAPTGVGGYFTWVWQGPVDQRFEMMQRSNIEYNEVQRSKMTF